MRSVLALAALLGATALTTAPAQEGRARVPQKPPPRYGVEFREKGYPQATPKQALESVIAAVDRGDFAYLAAHLLDPAFVDARVGDRAKRTEPAVEADLARLRDFQLRNQDRVEPEARIPIDAGEFRDRVAADAQAAAFRQLVRNVQATLADDPEVMKDLRRFSREGTFPEAAGDVVKVGLADVRDRAVFIRKAGDRWFVENRQVEERPPEPKEPEKKEAEKKEPEMKE
jgi:hypothetical protein